MHFLLESCLNEQLECVVELSAERDETETLLEASSSSEKDN